MKLLRRTQFGNPILRQKTNKLTDVEIKSSQAQNLIADMKHTLESRKFGVGLAAPQVGSNVPISVIGIKPTPTRPSLKREELVIVNPRIRAKYGSKQPMWEGCISGPDLYAQVPRYEKIKLQYQDEDAKRHEKQFTGFIAHVIQHEVDHLNGILFVDRVEDTKSYMTFTEYRKMQRKQKQ